MSCMIQKSENTAAIAAYIARLLNMGYDANGMEAPETLRKALREAGCYVRYYWEPEKIYKTLVSLNHAAFSGRYSGRYDENCIVVEYKENDISAHVRYNEHFLVEKWHYRIHKMIQFFNYQCLEDATRNTDLFNGMRELETRLAQYIVMNNDISASLPWE